MSMQDEAAKLRNIAASDGIPIAMLVEAEARVDGLFGQLGDALGAQSQHLAPLQGLASVAKQAISQATHACQQMETGIHDAADAHGRG